VTWFRHGDPAYPPLWELAVQPPGRWHGPRQGPAHYLADTPDGAWAEFCRHEAISDPADLEGVARLLWAVDAEPDPATATPELPARVLTGGLRTYRRCQSEAARLRAGGATAILAPSAALGAGQAAGWRTEGGLVPGPPRDGRVLVLFGPRPALVAWRTAGTAAPEPSLLGRVRPLR
jgi:hypothetical protein